MIAEGTKFEYSFYGTTNEQIGTLSLPKYLALPENSRLANVIPPQFADHVKINIRGQPYTIQYDVASPGAFYNDLKFDLVHQGNVIASALARHRSGFSLKRLPIKITSPRPLTLAGSGFWRFRFQLEDAGKIVGNIGEAPGFRLARRKFIIDLPDDLGDDVKAFIFFLAVNRAFR